MSALGDAADNKDFDLAEAIRELARAVLQLTNDVRELYPAPLDRTKLIGADPARRSAPKPKTGA